MAVEQAAPQAPQFIGSVWTLAQARPQFVMPAGVHVSGA
jgi:hypothetical protein